MGADRVVEINEGRKAGYSSWSPWWIIFAGSSLIFLGVGCATISLLSPFLLMQNRAQGCAAVAICSHVFIYGKWSG